MDSGQQRNNQPTKGSAKVGSGGGTTRGGQRRPPAARDATTFTGVDVPLGAETRATELSYTSFPENLEQSGSPYMLIKIFETITG
jgi:hypothetical protein